MLVATQLHFNNVASHPYRRSFTLSVMLLLLLWARIVCLRDFMHHNRKISNFYASLWEFVQFFWSSLLSYTPVLFSSEKWMFVVLSFHLRLDREMLGDAYFTHCNVCHGWVYEVQVQRWSSIETHCHLSFCGKR